MGKGGASPWRRGSIHTRFAREIAERYLASAARVRRPTMRLAHVAWVDARRSTNTWQLHYATIARHRQMVFAPRITLVMQNRSTARVVGRAERRLAPGTAILIQRLIERRYAAVTSAPGQLDRLVARRAATTVVERVVAASKRVEHSARSTSAPGVRRVLARRAVMPVPPEARDVASAPRAAWGDDTHPTRVASVSSAPTTLRSHTGTSNAPLVADAFSPAAVAKLTNEVIRTIDHRIVAQRERFGGRR